MDDAGEHRRFRVEVGDLAGDDLRQCRDMRGVLPESRRHGTILCRQGGSQRARDDRRCERAQIAKTQPQNGRAHVGDRATRGIEGARVGQRHDLCRQQGFSLDQAHGLVDVAIRIVERMLQFERDQRIGREVDCAMLQFCGDLFQDVVSLHGRIQTSR